MKTIKVIGRETIINPATGNCHDDAGLRALDGYYEEVFSVEDNYDKTGFILELEKEILKLKNYNLQIEEI